MMTAGFWIFGLVFCLLGTILLVALGVLALAVLRGRAAARRHQVAPRGT